MSEQLLLPFPLPVPAYLRLLRAIATNSSPDGWTHMSVRTLAAIAEYSQNWCKDAREVLLLMERAGNLLVDRTDRRQHSYTLTQRGHMILAGHFDHWFKIPARGEQEKKVPAA